MSIQTIAIILGVSNYSKNGIPCLPAAEIDAVSFARALKNWGVLEENILLLLNEEVDKETVDVFFKILSERKGKYKFLFYFCGHGHRTLGSNPQSYLVFYEDYFSLDFFIQKISNLNATESYILIDACHLRINHFINPKLEEETKGKLNSNKSLFCLLSSGIEASFENITDKYGYFTRALLSSLSQVKKSNGSPTQFLIDIQNEMKKENLPLPDMINFGNHKISFLPDHDFINNQDKIFRNSFISEIQDALIHYQNKIIIISGDIGCGKTAICQMLTSEKTKTIYFEIPVNSFEYINIVSFIESVVYRKFGCTFHQLDKLHPYYLIILDQIERLNNKEKENLFKLINESTNLRFLCVYRSFLENVEFECLDYSPLQLHVPPLTKEESFLFIRKIEQSYSDDEIELIYLLSKGNPKSIKNIIFDNNIKSYRLEELKKAIAAIYACGVCYDKLLFENVFNLKPGILDFLEQIHLIQIYEQSYMPDAFLDQFAESESLNVNSQTISKYWYQQAEKQPSNIQIARSLILSAKCFGLDKNNVNTLTKALKSLTIDEENLSYFIDGAEIFLPLSYQTKASIFLSRALKSLGENDLSNKLFALRKSNFFWRIGLACLFLTTVAFAFYFQDSGCHYIHIKQSHPDFIGRECYLEQLENKLIKKNKKNVIPIMVLWGESGVGKSEIAITFANRNLKYFDLIHWIDAATEESYTASYQHLAAQLNIAFEQKEPLNELVRKVHYFLENKNSFNSWLLIYDNAEKEYELPQRGNGSIIITTRDHIIWHLYEHCEITSFSEAEGFALFKKITDNDKNPNQLTLIKELENHPLSLNLASHYIAETPLMTEELFIELLSQRKIQFLDEINVDCRYPKGLLNSWKMTASELYKKNPNTLHWLYFCSYLQPDSIPVSWIREWLLQQFPGQLDDHSLKIQTNEILRLIINQTHMRCDKNKKNLTIHRLKQEIFKYDDYFNPEIKEKVLTFLVSSFEEFERTDEMERTPQIWSKLKEWEKHATWFLDKHSDLCSKDQKALLCNLLGSWKAVKGEYSLAEKYINQALNIRLELFGQNDLRTIIAINNKSWVLLRLCKFKESKELLNQALASLKIIVPPEHPYVSFIMNNLSLVLNELGEYESMKEFTEQVLNMRLKLYGNRHAYTADSMHNLAKAYWKLHEYDQAKNYFEQALDSYIFCYGNNHPYVAITTHSLARVLASMEDYPQAKIFFDEALTLYNKIYGAKHSYSAYCSLNLAQTLEKMGREADALNAFRMAFFNLKKGGHKQHFLVLSVLEELKQILNRSKNQEIIDEIANFLNYCSLP